MFKNSQLKRLLRASLLLFPPLYWWAVYYEPSHPKRVNIPLSQLPPRLSSVLAGKKITQISDLHCHRISRLEERALKIAEESKSDFMVLTGDFFDYSGRIEGVEEFIKRLNAPSGIYAVTGNVDTCCNDSWEKFFQSTRNRVNYLLDCSVRLDWGNGPVHLVGLNDPGWFDPDNSLERGRELLGRIPESEPKIVLAHQPDWAVLMEEFSLDLMLCGHTHGGQFRLPFGLNFYKQSAAVKKYPHGLYKVGRGALYVSSGIGTSDVRMRLGAPPEVVVIG
ncbi:MAG: metallophosphoesterase [bacterium]